MKGNSIMGFCRAAGSDTLIEIDLEPGEYALYCMANAEGSFHLFDGAISTFFVE